MFVTSCFCLNKFFSLMSDLNHFWQYVCLGIFASLFQALWYLRMYVLYISQEYNNIIY